MIPNTWPSKLMARRQESTKRHGHASTSNRDQRLILETSRGGHTSVSTSKTLSALSITRNLLWPAVLRSYQGQVRWLHDLFQPLLYRVRVLVRPARFASYKTRLQCSLTPQISFARCCSLLVIIGWPSEVIFSYCAISTVCVLKLLMKTTRTAQ